MSSRWPDRLRYALPLRLSLWYGVMFVVSSVALVGITYLLLAQSLRTRDHELIRSTLERYSTEYRIGGISALNRAISIDRQEGRHERLFVRVLKGDSAAIFFNMPADWSNFDLARLVPVDGGPTLTWLSFTGRREAAVLDVASARLPDGTLFQVGRSSEARDELLQHFRSRVLLVFVCIVSIAMIGGTLLTRLGLTPLRELTATVRTILQTGRLDSRVTVRETGDALDELGRLVNGMLDRIQDLVSGMRGALDNVAHDLRTPLMRLRSVIEGGLDSDQPGVAREALVHALEETERVASMLTTLMDISEAETGVMKLVRQPVVLADVVREACDLYADLAEDKQIVLEAHVPAHITLQADRSRLRQVLANLIDNALKYTPSGGRIDIAGRSDADRIVITVRDTGVGIPEPDLTRIWERLFRGDTSRSERGLGLGLSLVKAIVEAHGGQVAVKSTLGEGSEFLLSLPVSSSTDVVATAA